MGVHSIHLAEPGLRLSAAALWRPPDRRSVSGLRFAECLMPMRLGAPLWSPGRWQLGRVVMFAAWDSEAALDAFLADTALGRACAAGWHARLRFLRRWGGLAALDGLPGVAEETDLDAPVVAVTIARLRIPEVLRFLRWGMPVERQVRDHAAARLALAGIRPLRTLATFTVWQSARAMLDMVGGERSPHAAAMGERGRRAFHDEFVTLRYACQSEHGTWLGRRGIVPDGPTDSTAWAPLR